MENPIQKKRQEIANNIAKGFENDIEKARHGTYSDTAENRKLNRVGQEYGNAAKKPEQNQKQPKAQENSGGGSNAAKTPEEHAKDTSTEKLKEFISNEKSDPKLVAIAKKELESRGAGSEKKESKKVDSSLSDENIEKLFEAQANDKYSDIIDSIFDNNKLSDVHQAMIKWYYANSSENLKTVSEFVKKRIVPDLLDLVASNKKDESKKNEPVKEKNSKEIADEVFSVVDDWVEDKISNVEASSKMQKVIDDNKLSKKDFSTLYEVHGSDWATEQGGGDVTEDDMKEEAKNTIKNLKLKFSATENSITINKNNIPDFKPIPNPDSIKRIKELGKDMGQKINIWDKNGNLKENLPDNYREEQYQAVTRFNEILSLISDDAKKQKIPNFIQKFMQSASDAANKVKKMGYTSETFKNVVDFYKNYDSAMNSVDKDNHMNWIFNIVEKTASILKQNEEKAAKKAAKLQQNN